MSRSIRYDARGQQPWCQWLQNDTANYYFDRKADTIYLENHRMWNRDLSVCSLPTDPPQLTEFLAQVQGLDLSTEYVPAKGRALLVVAQRGRLEDSGGWRIVRHHNVLEEDYFRCDWPSGTRIVDRRDALHQRGWTCFRMEGTVNGKEISGVGRMPFVYAAAKWYPPWLRVYTADSSSILDLPSGAALCDIDGRVQAVYPAGSFFKGLARPWMGLHAIDTIRRDAAEQQLLFDITLQPKTDTSEVVVFTETGKLVYLVDMKRDLVDQISIDTGETEGELRFSYTEDNIAQSEHTGFARERGKHGGPAEQSDGILWLVHLAKEDLVK